MCPIPREPVDPAFRRLEDLWIASSGNAMTKPRVSTLTSPAQGHLPFWSGDERAVSNVLARGALFNSSNVRKGPRETYKRKVIATTAGSEITYSGEELRQDDKDVFLQLVHIARLHELGTVVHFTAYSLIKDLGWSRSGNSNKRLADCIDRLKLTQLNVNVFMAEVRSQYSGSLIRSFRWKEDGESLRKWEVVLEKEIIALFKNDAYSRVEWELRMSLPSLAKWLHSFYSTHREPLPYGVSEIYRISGSNIGTVRQFKYELKKALAILVERGFFSTARICNTVAG
ncbi:MAG: hypothetical protein EOO77_40465, partial [Oxalobacteraceae bacterium]